MAQYRIRYRSESKQSPIYSDVLVHHGIKGQKWGIRRFQNLDGTLTETGKKHYGISAKEFKEKATADAAKMKSGKRLQNKDGTLSKEGYDHYSKAWVDAYSTSGRYGEKAAEAFNKKGIGNKMKAVGYAVKRRSYDKKVDKIDKIVDESVKKTAENIRNQSNNFEEAKKKASEIGGVEGARIAVQLGTMEAKRDIDKLKMLSGDKKTAYQNQFLKELADDRKKEDDRALVEDRARSEGKPIPKREERDRADDARMGERAAYLQSEIEKKSGDWYNSKSVSEGFKNYSKQIAENRGKLKMREKTLREQNLPKDWKYSDLTKFYDALKNDKQYQAYKNAEKRLDGALMGQVLRDIGFPDTPENREYVMPYVFWD